MGNSHMQQAARSDGGFAIQGNGLHQHGLPRPATYTRRRPELTVLHQVVRQNYKSFVALVEASGRTLPKHVTAEFAEYLKCGILAHGFLRLKCGDCKAERLVAFSCRGRGFCPSCIGKRQALVTEFLLENLLGGLPVRQFVLSFPFELRFLMARDAKVMSKVLAIVNDSISQLYRKKAKAELALTGDLKTGAVTFIQRYGSSLNLNIHFHILVVEGLWQQQDAKDLATNPAAKANLQKLSPPNNDDIEILTRHIKDRITRLLVKKGYTTKNPNGDGQQPNYEQEGFFSDGAIIDDLQAASIQSRLATGPNTGKRVRKLGQQIHLPFYGEFKSPRCFAVDGYSLHANTFCHENESYKLRRLIEYVARPPKKAAASQEVTLSHFPPRGRGSATQISLQHRRRLLPQLRWNKRKDHCRRYGEKSHRDDPDPRWNPPGHPRNLCRSGSASGRL
jgi:hypothetical protein